MLPDVLGSPKTASHIVSSAILLGIHELAACAQRASKMESASWRPVDMHEAARESEVAPPAFHLLGPSSNAFFSCFDLRICTERLTPSYCSEMQYQSEGLGGALILELCQVPKARWLIQKNIQKPNDIAI